MPEDLSQLLVKLPELSKPELVAIWKQSFQTEANDKWRKGLLLQLLSYKLQEQAFTRLGANACRQLRQLARDVAKGSDIAAPSARRLKLGTRLARSWKGQVHVVHVSEEGFDYKGAAYTSLSEVARLITGTRWSGPLFFGLKPSQAGLQPMTHGKAVGSGWAGPRILRRWATGA